MGLREKVRIRPEKYYIQKSKYKSPKIAYLTNIRARARRVEIEFRWGKKMKNIFYFLCLILSALIREKN